jgi:hypothetical protein
VETWRLLQRADGVAKQLYLNSVTAVLRGVGIFHVEVADDALGSLVDEEAIAVDSSPLNGGKPGENTGVGVAKNHVSRGAIVPMKSISPDRDLLLHEEAQVGGGEMTKVENLHYE